ncbi:prolyl oligopeptidase family serine peptidase [Chitinophaga sp.]|uniref:carboxylesterase family protein n=1 Tax=Chitinophaga sp. TaxID=1869181 RepID=UPI002F947D23
MRVFLIIALMLQTISASAQDLKPFKQIEVQITPWHHIPALLKLPDNPKSGKRYPLLICLHGRSIAGTDVTKIFRQGVARQMHEGKNIDAVNKLDGKKYEFIVMAPLATSWSLGPEHLDVAITDVLKRYPIDSSRIYITGYSAGGWSVAMAVTDKRTAKRVAAAVNMSPATIDAENLKSFQVTAQNNIHVWYFGGSDEPVFLGNCKLYADSTNKYKPGLTKLSIGNHKHCCWEQYYNPSYREDGMNIYEWLLQFKR